MGILFSLCVATSFFFSIRLYLSLLPSSTYSHPMFLPTTFALVLSTQTMFMLLFELFNNRQDHRGKIIRTPLAFMLAILIGFVY